jgi:hypothetical protein
MAGLDFSAPGDQIAFVLEEVAAGRLVDALSGLAGPYEVEAERALLGVLFRHVSEAVLLAEADKAARQAPSQDRAY